ncbi:hypothetical protein [Kocuria rosea]|uniref:hypothetical protein n=1 Tax=Kocuria rosea TaxID=1275 RepID=UPI00253FF319|nr:hypothetical protein [Kocuria rosea]WIG18403.1 hypothetical protein QOY29_05595 [Kocuria rosea]
MPLFEPTLPANRLPKPKKQSRRKRIRLNTSRIWAVTVAVASLFVGVALIVANHIRTEAGNPPQGAWGGIGVVLISVVFLFVLLDSTEGRNRKYRR